MNLVDVTSDPHVVGVRPGFVICAALVCLFVVSAVALVIVLVLRGRGS